ncbi:hypothetical protein HMPREF1508_0039 [Shuttleworthella sp. MSX8B]|nr:hypothetical protein HMPREF1508_0039 [Shuttleworthia sp. MSX8B]
MIFPGSSFDPFERCSWHSQALLLSFSSAVFDIFEYKDTFFPVLRPGHS